MEELENIMVSLPYLDLVEATSMAIMSSVVTEEEAAEVVTECFKALPPNGKDLLMTAAKSLYIDHYNEPPEGV